MRKILIGLGSLVLVVLAALLIIPAFIDPNDYKGEIQAEVKKATGRDLTIAGDIGLSLLPSPSLSVDGVRLSNLEGGSSADMVTLKELRVNVALFPLLSGTVDVNSVRLVDPVIVLETTADGRANWVLENTDAGSTAQQTTAAPSGTSEEQAGGGAGFSIGQASIENGTLIYHDGATGEEQRITGIDLDVSTGGLQGPFELDGGLTYQGLPIELDGSVGAIDSGQATSITMNIGLEEDAAKLTVSGTLDLDAGPSFAGKLALDAADMAGAVARVTGALGEAVTDLPEGLSGATSIAATLAASPEAVKASDLVVTLGETRLQGEASVSLTDGIVIDAKLGGNRLDLDALMPSGSGTQRAAAPASAGSERAGTQQAGSDFAIPADLSASVELSVDAVQFKGAAIRQARLNATVTGGVVALDLLTAQLPGGTEVTVTGTLEAVEGAPRFAGRLDTVSDNIRGTLDWLGVDLEGVAADRLRKAAFSADVVATPMQVDISDGRIELDTTTAKGAVTLALRDRPAFGMSLDIDKINIDAYLPGSEGGSSTAGSTGGTTASGSTDSGASETDNPLAVLGTFDANMNITVGEATAGGIPIRGAKFDALLQQGTLTLRDVSVADAGGAKGKVTGVLNDAAGKPSVDIKFDVGAVSVERLARTLSTDVPIAPAKLGTVALAGSAAGDMSDVRLDVRLSLAGGTLGLKGSARPLEERPFIDLAYTLDHPNANALFDVIAPGALDSVGTLGGLKASGDIGTRDDGRYSTNSGIALAGAQINVIGNIDPFAASPDLNMAGEINHPETVRLIQTFAPDYRPGGGNQGPFKFRAEYKGPVDTLAISAIELIAGKITGTGSGSINLTEAKPRIDLSLAFAEVNVDPWLPEGTAKPQGAVPVAPPAGGSGKASDWSREKIDFSGLSAINAKLTAEITRIIYGSYVVDGASLLTTVENGVLDVSKLAGGMFGGTFDLKAQVADRPTPTASILVAVRNADVRQAASTAGSTDTISGILTYDTDLKTAGGSEFEMVSNLGGTGAFSVRDGSVEGFNLKSFSDRLKELDRSPDFLDLVQRSLAGGSTKFSELSGTYVVQNGILRSNDIKLIAEAAVGSGTAVVDLPPRQMDVSFSARLSEHENAPPIGVRLVGPLDNPRQIFETEQMQAYVVQRLAQRGLLRNLEGKSTGNKTVDGLLKGVLGGGATQQAPSTGATEPATNAPATSAPADQPATTEQPAEQPAPAPTQIKPEDAVKGLLKGILGN